MIYWKEWRSLRLRFFVLAAFYLVTTQILPIDVLTDFIVFGEVYIYLFSWGAAFLFIPAVLGMDTYVGEKDQETEDFLLSKPMSVWRLLSAKIGLRMLLTAILTFSLMAIALIRINSPTHTLYLTTPPYVILYVIASILIAQLVVLMITISVSARAPFQSTALIVGGALGAVAAGIPIMDTTWQMEMLQAPWGSFWIQIALFILTTILASFLLLRREAGRSVA
jgi:ABC-type transport system involved in multi-copper enzyme maturation permease subunit